MRNWELLANSSPTLGWSFALRGKKFYSSAVMKTYKRKWQLSITLSLFACFPSKFKHSESFNINVLYRIRAVRDEGRQESDLAPGSVTNNRGRAEQHFPKSVPQQQVLVRSIFARLLPWRFPTLCVHSRRKDFVLYSYSLGFFALTWWSIASSLVLLAIIYYRNVTFFLLTVLSRWWELYGWFRNCIILSKVGRNGWQEHWVCFL